MWFFISSIYYDVVKVDPRRQENTILASKLSPLHLCVHEIISDGHCLYRAIADQMERRANQQVRRYVMCYVVCSYVMFCDVS